MKTYTEQEVREVALRCMGFVEGAIVESREMLDSNGGSKWELDPYIVRKKAITYLDNVMRDMDRD